MNSPHPARQLLPTLLLLLVLPGFLLTLFFAERIRAQDKPAAKTSPAKAAATNDWKVLFDGKTLAPQMRVGSKEEEGEQEPPEIGLGAAQDFGGAIAGHRGNGEQNRRQKRPKHAAVVCRCRRACHARIAPGIGRSNKV